MASSIQLVSERGSSRAPGAPVRNPQRQVTGGVAVTQDITARKRAEETVVQNQRTFSELVECAAELRDRNEELERFNRGMVGRELRMVELKKEINDLCQRFGQAARYRTDLQDEEERT